MAKKTLAQRERVGVKEERSKHTGIGQFPGRPDDDATARLQE